MPHDGLCCCHPVFHSLTQLPHRLQNAFTFFFALCLHMRARRVYFLGGSSIVWHITEK